MIKKHTILWKGVKKKFFLEVLRVQDGGRYKASNCDGCFFNRDVGCNYPADDNISPKCISTKYADGQDRIYKEVVV